MRRLLSLVLLFHMPLVGHARSCNVPEADLLGAWEVSGGSGPFEQVEFASVGNRHVFNSWLHERPDIVNGAWTLRACVLSVSDPADKAFSFAFDVRMKGRNRIEIKEQGAPASIYVRLKAMP